MLTAEVVATFPAEPVSAREARRFLQEFLAGRGRSDLADAGELVLSEVVSNAVLHARTSIDVRLSLPGSGDLRVEVTDGSPYLPVQRERAAQATTGRGMELIAAYAQDCGVEVHGTEGKTVWFVLSADSDPEELSEQDLLDAWGSDLDGTADPDPSADGRGSVPGPSFLLLGLPPTLWLATRQHYDAVLRELTLYGSGHPDEVPPPDRLALAGLARAWVAVRVIAELDRPASTRDGEGGAAPAVPATLPAVLDLPVSVPADAAEAFEALQDVLDRAEQLAAAGRLLVRPGLPEIVALRRWACEQAVGQLSAATPPSPWPGLDVELSLDQDRQPVLDPPAWDERLVGDVQPGAVAADDSNRIVAVSASLAAALGWTVEDLVGRRVVVLVPPELREAHVAGFTRHLTTGETRVVGVPMRLPVLRADGSRVDCDFLIEQTPATSGRAGFLAWITPVD